MVSVRAVLLSSCVSASWLWRGSCIHRFLLRLSFFLQQRARQDYWRYYQLYIFSYTFYLDRFVTKYKIFEQFIRVFFIIHPSFCFIVPSLWNDWNDWIAVLQLFFSVVVRRSTPYYLIRYHDGHHLQLYGYNLVILIVCVIVKVTTIVILAQLQHNERKFRDFSHSRSCMHGLFVWGRELLGRLSWRRLCSYVRCA